jgi:hypothetical protein
MLRTDAAAEIGDWRSFGRRHHPFRYCLVEPVILVKIDCPAASAKPEFSVDHRILSLRVVAEIYG